MRAHSNRHFLFLGVIAVLGLALGCGHKGPPPGAIAFQVSTHHPSTGSAAGLLPHSNRPRPAAPLVYADSFVAQGADTIFLRRVRLVLMELAIAPSVANECEIEDGEDNPPCVEFGEDPVVFDLALGSTVVRDAQRAPATDYNLFQVILHRPDPNKDGPFLRANPDFTGNSVRVEGVVSHAGRRHDFRFTSPFNEQEEISIDPAIAVAAKDTLRVTLRVDVASWFTDADRQVLIDPATAAPGGVHEGTVRDNIRTSLKVFRDQNRDGLDDDHEQ